MKLEFYDSFAYYSNAQATRKWGVSAGNVATGAGARNPGGGYGETFSNGSFTMAIDDVGRTKWIVGFGFQILPTIHAQTIFQILNQFGGVIFNLVLRADGALYAQDGSGILGVTAGNITASDWYHVGCLVDFSAGYWEIYINNNKLALGSNLGSPGASPNMLSIMGQSGLTACRFSDFFAFSGTGATGIDDVFPGDLRVDILKPNGVGDLSQFTPSPNVPNWQNVDEVPADDDTSVNHTNSIGDADYYKYEQSSVIGTIYGVQVNHVARKADAGSRTMTAHCKSGGIVADGAEQSLTNSYHNFRAIFETDPATGLPWELGAGPSSGSGVNDMQLGIDLTS